MTFDGFFQDQQLQHKTKTKTTKKDAAVAETLYLILKDQGRITRGPNFDTWVNAVHLLHRRVSPDRVQQVLDWLKDTDLKADHIPVILSARSFSQKFERLEQLMKRHPKTIAVSELTEKQRHLYEVITQSCSWPANIQTILPALIQQSWISFTDFFQRLNQLHVRYSKELARHGSNWKDASFARFLEYACAFLQQCPSTYLAGWFDEMHSIHCRSKSILRPSYLVWDPHDLLFEKQVWHELDSWGSFATAWNRVKRELEV